jgi:uncharacterized membrane protein
MRKQLFPLLFVSVIILSGAFAFPARATVYSPGVKPGDYVTLGHVTYTANGTLPPNFSELNGTSSLTNTVTNVNAKNVTVLQYWTFNNGTKPRQDTVQGDVETGKGNLTLFVIAGGLTAGDPVNQVSQGQNFFGVINQTVTREYAGAARTVNVVNSTFIFQQYFIKAAIYNDAATGFLMEFSESGHLPNGPTTSVSFSFDAVVTLTNVWSPSTKQDFSFDAVPASSTTILQGQSLGFHLNLTSFQGFTGSVVITAGLIAANSTITNHVTVTPASSTINVPSSKSATETLTASSTSSTPVGLYILTVNATFGTLSHSDHLTVRIVSPNPDFTIAANNATLQIPQGTSRISTITLTSQNGLSGTANIYAYSSDPTNLSNSPTSTSVVLTAGGTASFDMTMSAASNAPAVQYSVVVTAVLGSAYHTVTIYPIVTTASVGDFSISANPISLIIPQGHAKYTNVTLASLNGFSGTVSIGYHSTIRGAVDVGASTETLASGGTQNFRVEIYVPLSTPVGNYYLNVSGTALSTHTVKIPVQVISSSLPGFNITITPASQSITQGLAGTAKVTIRSLNGFQGTVTIKSFFSNLPTNFNPTSVTLTAGQALDSTLTISPSNGVAPGLYPVDVEGQTNSTGAYDSIYTNITVTPGTQPNFSLTPTSTTITFAANSLGTDNLRVDALNGFTGTVSFIRVAFFGGVSYDCTPVTLTSTATSGTSVCAFSSSTPGTYTAIVNGTGGSPAVSHKVTYTVTVIKASPTISTTLSASTITVGDSVTDSATLTGTDIFIASGTVTYQYFTGSSCTGTPTVVGSPVAVTYGLIPTSQPQTFNTAGAFSWNAAYSGDAANNRATSTCEPLTVNTPIDYTLTATPTTGSITAGSTFTATISAGLTHGVGSPVTLIVNVSPNPAVCQPSPSPPYECGTFGFSPATITPTSAGATSTLTIATTTVLPPGTYTLTITGLPAGASSSSATITLTVTAPVPNADFTLLPPSISASANPDTAITGTVTVAPLNGFTGTVGLSATVSPSSGLTCTLSKSSITSASGTSTLSCTGSVGVYVVTITGTSGSLSHTAHVTVVIQYSSTTGCHDGTCIIHSDSAISNVNLSGSTLHFQADGPSGTTGHANVTIPIGSVPNKANLKVFVDNSQLPSSSITIVSDSNNYYVSFSFTFHSPAQIDIQLTAPENAATPTILGLSPTLFYTIIAVIVAAVVVVLIAVVVVKRRRVSASKPQPMSS